MNGITYFNRMVANMIDLYHEINTATLTGAIDVIVIDQPDGTFKCSPFHVRFGKLGVLRYREKTVDISINDEPQSITMKLGENGEAFFVEEIPENERKSRSESDDSTMDTSSSGSSSKNDETTGTAAVQFHSYSENNLLSKKPNVENEQDQFNRRYTDGTIDELHDLIGAVDFRIENADDAIELELTTSGADDDLDDDCSTATSKTTATSIGTSVATTAITSGGVGGRKKKRRKTLTKKKKSGPNENLRMDNQDSEKFFFSDTELQSNTRPSSPVQSDSELEVSQRKKSLEEHDEDSWTWGQLPKVQPINSDSSAGGSGASGSGTAANASNSEMMMSGSGGDRSGCGDSGEHASNSTVAVNTADKRSVLSGMFSFLRHSRKNSNEKNIGGLYLSDLDVNHVDPEIFERYFPNRCRSISVNNDDCESGNGPSLPLSPTNDMRSTDDQELTDAEKLEIMLADNNILLSLCGWDEPPTEESFMKHLIEFEDFVKNPSVLESTDLVIRLMDKFYHWKVASPLIMSWLVFRKPLPESAIEALASDISICGLKLDDKNDLKLNSAESKSYSWWRWSRKTETNQSLAMNATSGSLTDVGVDRLDCVEARFASTLNHEADEKNDSLPPLRADTFCDETKETEVLYDERNCRRTLRLSSKQIESLNLKPGRNKAVFSVTTAYQGTSRCKCFIYRWRYDDKIVVSDIDGTITKSDVLGHILPIMGKDWAQTGVAQLFTKIKNNGYKLLYLSSRAIGQSRGTRDYLKSIKQNELTLPEGPILLNPTSLIIAFQKEVIEKTPEKFKIQCLQDINALFPVDSHPFCAGYGNKVNDVWSYRSVNIPIERIFTINHRGELKHELTQTFRSSYINMSLYVDELYPPLKDTAMDYSQFLYWRDPIADINPTQIVQSIQGVNMNNI